MADRPTAETGTGGWVRFEVENLPGPLLLRFRPDDEGRLRVAELYLPSDGEPIEARHLRALPLHKPEAIANSRVFRKAVEAELDEPVGDLRELLAGWCAWDDKPRPRRCARRVKLPPLPRPEGFRYDDDFYELVADHYVARVQAGTRPARGMADEAGVPVTTVHRWVREARRRGFLAPTTRGRTG